MLNLILNSPDQKLHYVQDSENGYKRMRKGKGFAYFLNDSLLKNKNLIARFRTLVIPPAWKNVWICKSKNGHLQATGIDERGRKQYIYHPEWTKLQQENKFNRIIDFGKALPLIRKKTHQDMRKLKFTKNKVIALALKVMEETLIRAGNTYYRDQNNSYGLTTLTNKHVKVKGSEVTFKFKGKKGVLHEISIRDPKLSKQLKNVGEIPGQHLFQYVGEDGVIHSIDSGDLNRYIQECTKQDFTSKDFRTWHGTVWYFRKLCEMDPYQSKKECQKNIIETYDFVACKLGNTRSVCRKYYVATSLIKAYEDESVFPYIKRAMRRSSKASDLQKAEKQVLKLLEFATKEKVG